MKIQVLDHGYIELIESWGSDERIIEAARMSTGKGFQGWGMQWKCRTCGSVWSNDSPSCKMVVSAKEPCDYCNDITRARAGFCEPISGDEKLLAYLYNNKHTTPFEMAGMVIEVQAPIMVFREWHRHRTQSYNEMSGRYIALPDVNYVPTIERLMLNSKTNRQAGTIQGAEELTDGNAATFLERLADMWEQQESLYQWALSKGVPKELARVHIGVGRYSRMRASANLLNWLKFLTLRMDVKAQYEIRMYANEVGKMIAQAFPRTWELFNTSSH